MSTNYRNHNRSHSDGRLASSRPVAQGNRVVKISWNELRNMEALYGLDHYQIDDIGFSHSENSIHARKMAEDRKAARSANR